MNILVSACLLGVSCRYDGVSKTNEHILDLLKKHTLIPICPEQLGGLATPRLPAECTCNEVVTKDGTVVTDAYLRGAFETLRIAQLYDCELAILKERSPSCGCNGIYDGTFTHTLIDGMGITVKLLREHGIKIIGESESVFL